jgi:hypothetical protein
MFAARIRAIVHTLHHQKLDDQSDLCHLGFDITCAIGKAVVALALRFSEGSNSVRDMVVTVLSAGADDSGAHH